MIIIAITFAIDALIFLIFKNVIDQTVLNMFSVLFNSVVLFYVFKKNTQSKWILTFLILSYIVRLGYLFFDIYANGTYLLFNDYIDSMGFHMNAEKIVNGTIKASEASKGNYSVLVSIFYRVFGINKFMGQYANVLVSMATQILFIKLAKYLKIDENKIIIPMAVICFFPASILYGTMLVREAISIFAVMSSIFFFVRWYKEGRIRFFIFSIVILVLISLLHSGFLILIFAYIFVLALYDKDKGKLVWSWKMLIIFLLTIGVIIALYFIFRSSLFGKWNVLFSGKIKRVFRYLQRSKGDSAYLPDITYRSVWDIIKNAPIRVFHYLLSPVPWQWRGIKDIGTFFVDSLFYLTFLIIWIPLFIKTKKENRLLFIVFSIQFILFTLVFAHGTYTAGTAIRHRSKSVILLATVYLLSGNGDPFNLQMLPRKIKKFITQKRNREGKE